MNSWVICQALIVLLRLHPIKLCHCQPIYKSYTLASIFRHDTILKFKSIYSHEPMLSS
nr:MAG TPA: hypothetical protein [Caudoviricetes sp.]DAY73304.1 MAG TPA: hypothetical protein [Caudoviricetes sp.]